MANKLKILSMIYNYKLIITNTPISDYTIVFDFTIGTVVSLVKDSDTKSILDEIFDLELHRCIPHRTICTGSDAGSFLLRSHREFAECVELS